VITDSPFSNKLFRLRARNADGIEGTAKTASLPFEEEPKGYAYIGAGMP